MFVCGMGSKENCDRVLIPCKNWAADRINPLCNRQFPINYLQHENRNENKDIVNGLISKTHTLYCNDMGTDVAGQYVLGFVRIGPQHTDGYSSN